MILFALFIISGFSILGLYLYLGYRDRKREEAERYGALFGPVCDIREQLLKSDEYGRLF